MAIGAAGMGDGAVDVTAGAAAWLWERRHGCGSGGMAVEAAGVDTGTVDASGYKNPQQLF